MTLITRDGWGAASASAAEPLDPNQVEGIAIHWPAMREPLRGAVSVSAALRSWQRMHMAAPRNYRDIAYQVAVDQDGNRYVLRGLRGQSAANGDLDVNRRFGAVLLILAPGEHPTGEMLAELEAVITEHRHIFPRSTRIVGHQDVRPEPTACPGPIVQRLIDAGDLEPRPSTRATRNAITKAVKRAKADGMPRWARRGLQRVRANLKRWEQR